MPGLQNELLGRALGAGIPLSLGRKAPWLTGRGHLADVVQQQAPAVAVEALARIHSALSGDANALGTKRPGNPPIPDLIHDGLGCVIEVDESQHFTTARRRALELYPASIPLGYDVAHYRVLIDQWHPQADRAFAHKVSTDFPGPGGRQAQRAYNDALRDLLAPTFTGYPVIRVTVPDRRLDTALDQLREALKSCQIQH